MTSSGGKDVIDIVACDASSLMFFEKSVISLIVFELIEIALGSSEIISIFQNSYVLKLP